MGEGLLSKAALGKLTWKPGSGQVRFVSGLAVSLPHSRLWPPLPSSCPDASGPRVRPFHADSSGLPPAYPGGQVAGLPGPHTPPAPHPDLWSAGM